MTTAEVVETLRARAQEELSGTLSDAAGEDAEARAWALLVDLVEGENRRRVLAGSEALPQESRTQIARDMFDIFFRLGPLQQLLDDEDVEEIGGVGLAMFERVVLRDRHLVAHTYQEPFRLFIEGLAARSGSNKRFLVDLSERCVNRTPRIKALVSDAVAS